MARACEALGTNGPIKAVSCNADNFRTGLVGVRVPRFCYQYFHQLLHIKETRFTAMDSAFALLLYQPLPEVCGTMSNLEVHHREFRSHSGADSEENLITLCTACHARVHRR